MRYIARDVLESDDGAAALLQLSRKRNLFQLLSMYVFSKFMMPVNTLCGDNESFHNFETFSSAVFKYSRYGSSIVLPETILALIWLANFQVSEGQRVTVPSTAPSKAAACSHADLPAFSENDSILKVVKYEGTPSVVRSCLKKVDLSRS